MANLHEAESIGDKVNTESATIQNFSSTDAKLPQLEISADSNLVNRSAHKPEGKRESQDYALGLIEMGESTFLLSFYNQFAIIDHNLVAGALIQRKEHHILSQNLDKLNKLNFHTAKELIDSGYAGDVAENISSFDNQFHLHIADYLINNGHCEELVGCLREFNDLDHKDIVLNLNSLGQGHLLALYLGKFDPEVHNFIATELIRDGQAQLVIDNRGRFSNLHDETLRKLDHIVAGEINSENLPKGQGASKETNINVMTNWLSTILREKDSGSPSEKAPKKQRVSISGARESKTRERAESLISSGRGDLVVKEIEQYKSTSHNFIANALFKDGQSYLVATNLERFQSLNLHTAKKLISFSCGKAVAQNISKFREEDHDSIAKELIRNGNSEHLVRNLEQLGGLVLTRSMIKIIRDTAKKHDIDLSSLFSNK